MHGNRSCKWRYGASAARHPLAAEAVVIEMHGIIWRSEAIHNIVLYSCYAAFNCISLLDITCLQPKYDNVGGMTPSIGRRKRCANDDCEP